MFINTQRLGGLAEHLRLGLRVVLYTAHDVEIEAIVRLRARAEITTPTLRLIHAYNGREIDYFISA